MAMKFAGVAAAPIAAYDAEIDYDNEHRDAEHEPETDETPEPGGATEFLPCLNEPPQHAKLRSIHVN
jgi:hypothetical protein